MMVPRDTPIRLMFGLEAPHETRSCGVPARPL